MDSSSNVTIRKSRMRRSFSCLSNESMDSLSSNLSVKSMMDLSTHLQKDETFHLRHTIENLKEQITCVHLEIETLGLENASLKQQLSDERLKTEHFRKMYTASTIAKSTTFSCNTETYKKYIPNKSKLSARKLNLDIDFQTPKPSSNNTITDILTEEIETKETITKEADGITEDKIQESILHEEHNSKFKITSKPGYGNILVLSDDQGKGIVQGLLKKEDENYFILQKYAITGFRKPGATTEEVLLCCNKLTENFTKNDSVVIMTGQNDSNPIKFMAEMSAAVKILKDCNIIIVSVKSNAFLNESKLNYQLKVLAQNYKNCTFIEANSYNNIIKQLAHNINVVQYYNKYLLYNNNIGLMGKPGDSEDMLKSKKNEPCPVVNTSMVKPILQPKKGTIPYYFFKVEKPQSILKNMPSENITMSKEPFFRNQ